MRWRTCFFKQRTIVISSSFFASCLEKWQSELSTSYLFEASDTRWWPDIYFLSTSLLISLHGDSLSQALPLLLRKSAFSHGKMHVLKSGSIWWGQTDKSASRTWKIKQHKVSVWAAGHCSSTGQCKEAWKSILWNKSKDIWNHWLSSKACAPWQVVPDAVLPLCYCCLFLWHVVKAAASISSETPRLVAWEMHHGCLACSELLLSPQ